MKFDELMLEERKEGLSEGLARGKVVLLIEQTKKKCQKGKSLKQIADELEEDQEQIEKIARLVIENKDDTPEEIAAKMEN